MTNIVICSDGTCAEFGPDITNVVKLYQRVVRNQDQKAFYDPGLGTFSIFGRHAYLGQKLGKLQGMALGAGIRQNIEEAYRYLMNHYQINDRVFLFGYSRGAYTVRALAGMLKKCGLIEKGSDNLVSYASKIYNTWYNDDEANEFKNTFSVECKPYFIGVWDTVGSLGWMRRQRFYDTRVQDGFTYGYQAVSVDESRQHFPISLWRQEDLAPGQLVHQVWFPGYHADIGGQNADPPISDITLKWMLTHAQRKGLVLKDRWQEFLHPDPSGEIKESYTGFWMAFDKVPRSIPEQSLIHTSVFERMADPGSKYGPSNLPSSYTEVAS